MTNENPEQGNLELEQLVQRARNEKISLPNSPTFNGFTQLKQRTVLRLYQEKLRRGELPQEEDRTKSIEKTALLYHSQLCAFQNVLLEQGFDPTPEVEKSYSGRIAILTHYGTLFALGKLSSQGRLVKMDRIYAPELKYFHRVNILEDLKMGIQPELRDAVTGRGNDHSNIIGLATNLNGSDDDELEEKGITSILEGIIKHRTSLYVKQPTSNPGMKIQF